MSNVQAAKGAPTRLSGLLTMMAGVLLMTSCSLVAGGDGGQEQGSTSSPGGSSERSSASATEEPSDGGAASSASDGGGTAAPASAGTRCAENDGWAVVVAQGEVDCATAASVIADYEDTEDIAPGGRPANPESVQGWTCEPIIFAKMGFEPDTYTSWCQSGQRAIMTMDARTELPATGTIRKPSDFSLHGLGDKEAHWGFMSPSGSWYCGLVDNPRPEHGLPSGAHCFVIDSTGIPGTDVDQPGGGGTATAVSLDDTVATAEPYYSGDLALVFVLEQTPVTLDYGEVLYARGGACTIDREAGVTCTYGGRGFTVSTHRGLSTS